MRQELLQFLPFQDLAYKMPRWLYTHMGLTMAVVRMLFYLPPVLFLLAVVAWLRRPGGSPVRGPAGGCRLVDYDASPDSQVTKAATANRALGMLYLATSMFLFLGIFPRADAHHLVMVLAPSFVLVAWLIGPAPGRGVQAASVCVAVLLLALSIAPQFVWKEFKPPWLDYAFLELPRARIWMQDEDSANRLRHLVETARQRIPPGEPVFIGPAEPMYYFLIDRPNPTRYPLILPGALDETEVIRDLETKQVRYALLSDFAFEQFTFEHVAPALWRYVTTHYGPADGASWEVAPLPPYLRRRGAVERQGMVEVRTARRGVGQAQGVGSPSPSPAPVSSVTVDPSRWKDGWSLMRPSPSDPPPYRVEARGHWVDLQPERRVAWESMFLRSALVMRAPWGWRKIMATWEVPVEDGLAFEVSSALSPSAWGMPSVEGQGAIVEVWISPAEEGALPRRAWIRWLDPRRRLEDRHWFRVAVDLASFVGTPRARVTLVAGPAPTFDGSDAEIAWAGIQLVRIHPERGGGEVKAAASRPVLLDDAAAAKILAFDADDLAIFREAAASYQSLPEAHTGLAAVAASVGRHREALEAWKRAVGLNPTNPVYRVRLGEALERVGQAEEAVAAMRAAVAITPEEPNYHVALAALLLRLGRPEQSRRAVEEAFRRDPAHPWALTVLSALERGAKNYESAAGAARRAIVRQPESLRAHLDLVEALQGGGRVEEALAALERASALKLEASALDLEPGSRALVARGFLALGKPQRARTEAAAAVAAAPTSFNAWATLGDAAAAAGDMEAAVDAWRRAVAQGPAPFGALLELGRALAAAGRSDASLGALAAALREAGENPSQHLELALAYARIGRPTEAAGEWKRILALAPGGPLEEEARRHLKLEAHEE
jgi:tetratricopeptide (TPR) repeat protein